jgi:hypothetical protein
LLNIGKSQGRNGPNYQKLDANENRFVSFNDFRLQSASKTLDMKRLIPREVPWISKLGCDKPRPMICYEHQSSLSSKCISNFKK